MPAPELLLTPAETAARWKVDVKTLTRWTKAGKIHSVVTPGGVRRYFESEVSALLRGETWELPAGYAPPQSAAVTPLTRRRKAA